MSDEIRVGRPTIIVQETASGVIIHNTPLSVFTIQSIRERAEQEFPYPDLEPYRMTLENVADPSIKAPAEDNPEYQALCKPIDAERIAWRVRAYIDIGCTFPAFESRDAMIAHFRPRLEQLRKVSKMGEDDWQNVLDFCVFTGKKDKQIAISVVTQDEAIPLTPAEVVEGIRYFRLQI